RFPSSSLVPQVGMASSPSFSVSSFSTNSSSSISPPRAEERRPSVSSGNESGPPSSSSGTITRVDAKALQALEAIKSFHYFDSVITFESLASIRKRYSVSDKYILHAPRLGQHPYHPCPGGFNIPVDALEHELDAWQSQGRRGALGNRFLSSAPASTPVSRAESGSTSEVQEIPIEEATRPSGEEGRGVPEVPRKRQAEDSAGHRKKDRHKSHQEADRSATKGKGPVDTAEEPPTPRRKPKSVRELCSVSVGVDGRDYHAIRICSLPECAPDAPLDIDLTPLTHGMWVWLDGEASTRYIRGTLISRLASDLYTLSSEVLMDGATKAMVLSQHYHTTLFDRVHNAGRVITSLDIKVDLLRKEVQRLKEDGDPNALAASEAGHWRPNL
ncbi:hypothetical protein BHE74_00006650, partial [Ensete ventricosum]